MGSGFTAYVVCRRYWSINLRSVKKLGIKQGGEYVEGIHFSFAGGQVRSLMSLLSYFGKEENRERYLGGEDPAVPPQARLPGAGSGVRERAGGSAVRDGRARGEASTREWSRPLQLSAGGED